MSSLFRVSGILLGLTVFANTAIAQGQGQGQGAIQVPGDHSTISAAVSAADPGDRVVVSASGGPYVEQVVINKDLTLVGKGNPTVQRPASPNTFKIPESAQEWEPVIFAVGGTLTGSQPTQVSGSGTVSVDISGFTIDRGGNQAPVNSDPATDRGAGILERNIRGDVSGNTVQNLGAGGKETFGIVVYGNSDVTISSNTVTGYGRGGIFVTGGESGPAPTGRINGNTVTAPGAGNSAPNGIQIGGGARGSVMNNTVKNNVHPNAASGGILVVESDGIRVRGNRLRNNDYGIGVFTFFPAAPLGGQQQGCTK